MIVPFHPFPQFITPASAFKVTQTQVKFIGTKHADRAILLFRRQFPGRELVEIAEIRGVWRIRYI